MRDEGSHSGRRVEFDDEDSARSRSHDDDHDENLDMTTTPSKGGTTHTDSESPGLKTVGTDDTTLTINHVNSTRNGSRGLGGMGKPLIALMGLLTLSSLGAGIWGFLTIPGLYDQIEELEFQVDRLEGQVDRLEGEVDRFAVLNSDLNATVIELQGINRELNETATRLEDSVDNLELLNDQLAAENNRYVALNGQLNETANRLEAEVDALEVNVDALEVANAELREVTEDLQDETERLGDTVESLNSTAADLRNENNRLKALNANLETIVGFLNETSGEISDTLENVTAYLAEQITGSRELLLENLEISYSAKIANWDCAFRNTFLTDPFIQNPNAPIGADTPRVLAHVEDRILAEFCVNRENFELYLESRFGLVGLTASQLIQATNEYTGFVLSYYFPDPGQSGLTTEDWAEADYDCEGLPDFVWSP